MLVMMGEEKFRVSMNVIKSISREFSSLLGFK